MPCHLAQVGTVPSCQEPLKGGSLAQVPDGTRWHERCQDAPPDRGFESLAEIGARVLPWLMSMRDRGNPHGGRSGRTEEGLTRNGRWDSCPDMPGRRSGAAWRERAPGRPPVLRETPMGGGR